MHIIAVLWGTGGVVALLSMAIYRLSPRVAELDQYSLGPLQWLVLVGFTLYMLYAEGYRGFHCNFAPRVVLRATAIRHSARPLAWLFAPLFCMGYFYATPRRRITSILLTTGIIVLVILVSQLPQPWRGIIDVGVISGLGLGILSIAYYLARALSGQMAGFPVAADLPADWHEPVVSTGSATDTVTETR